MIENACMRENSSRSFSQVYMPIYLYRDSKRENNVCEQLSLTLCMYVSIHICMYIARENTVYLCVNS